MVNIDFFLTFLYRLLLWNYQPSPSHPFQQLRPVCGVCQWWVQLLPGESLSPFKCTPSSHRYCQCKIKNDRHRKCISTIFTSIECCSFPAILSPATLRESCAPCLFWHQRTKAPLTRSDSGNSDDNYVPMNPGSSPLSAAQADSPKNIYIPMSPGPHHFDFPGFSATLPARKGSSASLCHRPSRLSDVTPPPINRNLKPNRKCEFLTAKFSQIEKRGFSF